MKRPTIVWSRTGALNFLRSRRGYSSFQEYVRVDPLKHLWVL